MRLRQIALVAHDLDSTLASLCEELGADVCFQDPGVGAFGLHNGLLALGDTFLEVVSPTQDGTTAGRYLDRRGGDGGYMVLLQLDADERARLWRYIADELPSGAPAVIEMLPPERPIELPMTKYRELAVGTFVYEGWQCGEPAGD